MKPNQDTLLALLTAPLLAASNANNSMAMNQVDFMLKTCFTLEDGVYKPILIKLVLSSNVMIPSEIPGEPAVLKPVNNTFELPILTIIPLNSLVVEKVDIDFNFLLKGVAESATADGKPELMGTVVEDDAGAGMPIIKVSLHVGQMPLPQGLNMLITAATANVSPLQS
jgi:hypothetical protein